MCSGMGPAARWRPLAQGAAAAAPLLAHAALWASPRRPICKRLVFGDSGVQGARPEWLEWRFLDGCTRECHTLGRGDRAYAAANITD